MCLRPSQAMDRRPWVITNTTVVRRARKTLSANNEGRLTRSPGRANNREPTRFTKLVINESLPGRGSNGTTSSAGWRDVPPNVALTWDFAWSGRKESNPHDQLGRLRPATV